MMPFNEIIAAWRALDATVDVLADVTRALEQVSGALSELSARVDRLERAAALLACDDALAGDTRLDVGLVLMGGEPS